MNDNVGEVERLAGDVMRFSRDTLIVKLRFMDTAIARLEPEPSGEIRFGTDGDKLYYDPVFVLKEYRRDQTAPSYDYIHTVMHCVFRHMFVSTSVDRELWTLACDVAVEAAIAGLMVGFQPGSDKQSVMQRISAKVGKLTAERIYKALKDGDFTAADAAKWRRLFEVDAHDYWYPDSSQSDKSVEKPRSSSDNRSVKQPAETQSGQGGEQPDSSQSGQGGEQPGLSQEDTNDDAGGGTSGSPQGGDEDSDVANGEDSLSSVRERIEREWKDISERINQDLETFSKSRGDGAGAMLQNLAEVNRERYDYTAFLKKFAVLGETMKINDDEFDYIFYTYGMKLYGKMPLIEPLEYKEVKRIKEFVIAIDTSGSVQGELVQNFVKKTYNILLEEESFFSKINLHIIQCDAEIQQDVKITSREEFDEYLKDMKLFGFGGTDFRPVFDYVDQLRKNHEFTNLKGLIYFTDGYGVFPASKPDYDTAFVFVEEGFNNPDVPVWAIKLVLRPDEI